MKPEELKVEVENFVKCVDELISNEYKKSFTHLEIPKLVISEGSKYYKLVQRGSCWGFISKIDGDLKGSPIKVGDLLKPANWATPAKHSRGNILDGTASYGVYGPTYIN
jgi:hypothetical protein